MSELDLDELEVHLRSHLMTSAEAVACLALIQRLRDAEAAWTYWGDSGLRKDNQIRRLEERIVQLEKVCEAARRDGRMTQPYKSFREWWEGYLAEHRARFTRLPEPPAGSTPWSAGKSAWDAGYAAGEADVRADGFDPGRVRRLTIDIRMEDVVVSVVESYVVEDEITALTELVREFHLVPIEPPTDNGG